MKILSLFEENQETPKDFDQKFKPEIDSYDKFIESQY